jgi:hypothetical protein
VPEKGKGQIRNHTDNKTATGEATPCGGGGHAFVTEAGFIGGRLVSGDDNILTLGRETPFDIWGPQCV